MVIQIKKYRELSLDELYQILKLRVDVFVVEQNCAYPELDNRDQDADHLIAYNKESVSGYLRIYYPEDSKAAIGRVAISQDYRGQGLARKLMEVALDSLEINDKWKTICLQAQDHLLGFYESFGFKKKSDVYLEDGIPHINMELSKK